MIAFCLPGSVLVLVLVLGCSETAQGWAGEVPRFPHSLGYLAISTMPAILTFSSTHDDLPAFKTRYVVPTAKHVSPSNYYFFSPSPQLSILPSPSRLRCLFCRRTDINLSTEWARLFIAMRQYTIPYNGWASQQVTSYIYYIYHISYV